MLPLREIVQTNFVKLTAMARSHEWRAHIPPLPVTTAAACGVVGGVALGAVVGPVGVALGIWLGLSVGAIAGKVIIVEDEKTNARTRELDDIIGITRGTLGAGAGATTKPARANDDGDDFDNFAASPYSDRETWAAEWLTPPPPAVG